MAYLNQGITTMSDNYADVEELIKQNKITRSRVEDHGQERVFFHDKSLTTTKVGETFSRLNVLHKLTPDDYDYIVISGTIFNGAIIENISIDICENLNLNNIPCFVINGMCNATAEALDYIHSKMNNCSEIENVLLISFCSVKEVFDRCNAFESSIISDNIAMTVISRKYKNESFEIVDTSSSCYCKMPETTYIQGWGHLYDIRNYSDYKQMKLYGIHDVEETKKIFILKLILKYFRNEIKSIKKRNNAVDIGLYILTNQAVYRNVHLCKMLKIDYNKSTGANNRKYGHCGASDSLINITECIEKRILKDSELAIMCIGGNGFMWNTLLLKYVKK